MKTRSQVREEIIIGLENYMAEFSPDNIIFLTHSISPDKYEYTYQDAYESAVNDTTMDPTGENPNFNFVDMLFRANIKYFNDNGEDQDFTNLPKPYVEEEVPETPIDDEEDVEEPIEESDDPEETGS